MCTIIKDDHKCSRTTDKCSRTISGHPRCTGCTTFVPIKKCVRGTPPTPIKKGLQLKTTPVYQVYHRFCVSFSNRPWTVVRKSWLKTFFYRYKWYTYKESLLTRGFPVYHLLFHAGTPFDVSSMKSITYVDVGVPGCTGNINKLPFGQVN